MTAALQQRDTNKRPRMASAEQAQKAEEDADLSAEIAAVAAKNAQLQAGVASLKRKFSLREEETHQLLLGLGALNAVGAELEALQREHQTRAAQNAALLQESLAQISSCSAQVDALKRGRGLSAQQLLSFRRECAQQMNRLVDRLAALADGDDDDGGESRRQVERLKQDVGAYRARVEEEEEEPCKGGAGSTTTTTTTTTERINVALNQLDELHAELFQLKQRLGQENQSFRRYLEDLVSQQMAQIREVQDNETERIHEEMDDIRSGMCGILKDMHRLKERTKYMVPSMARVGPGTSPCTSDGLQARAAGDSDGDQNDERRPTAIPRCTGYSITMATGQCRDELPHYEHGYDDDCYCPGVMPPTQTEVPYACPDRPRSPRSSNSSAAQSDDENWRMSSPPATGQRAVQPCESPHYSSRSSSLSGRLSVYGEEHVVPNDKPTAEQFEQQLLEQHRLFWIGEGAG